MRIFSFFFCASLCVKQIFEFIGTNRIYADFRKTDFRMLRNTLGLFAQICNTLFDEMLIKQPEL